MTLQLYIGNKNYSSWSMRPWVLLKQAGIPFEGQGAGAGGRRFSDLGHAGNCRVCGRGLSRSTTLARRPLATRPRPQRVRRNAQRLHRAAQPLPHEHRSAAAAHWPAGVARLCGLWGELLAAQPTRMPDGSAPLLFGHFTVADAYFAPVCSRLRTYGLPLPADIAAYVDRVLALPGVAAWVDEALQEADFLDFEEPYRLGRD